MNKKAGSRKSPVPGKVALRTVKTGVMGLDAVLGGGAPELSFNLIVGDPGSGKTTLAMAMLFAHATPAEMIARVAGVLARVARAGGSER